MNEPRTRRSGFQFGLRYALLFFTAFGGLLWGVMRYQMTVLRQTGRSLDLATIGPGYFNVTDPSGEIRFSRRGSLFIDANDTVRFGGLKNSPFLEPSINVPGDWRKILISPEGLVSVKTTGDEKLIHVGQIQLADFKNVAGLKEISPDVFVMTADSGEPTLQIPGVGGFGLVRQGWLESRGGFDVPSWLPNAAIFAVLGYLMWEVRGLRRRLDELAQARAVGGE